MYTLLLIVHVLVAVGIVVFVLLQRGKGAEAGASFGGGGASQTVFGSQGSANFLSRTTAILATTFFLTSFGLAYFANKSSVSPVGSGLDATVINELRGGSDVPRALDVQPEATTPGVE